MANEVRLIDANALLEEMDKFANPMPNKSGYEFLHGIATAITEIEDAPTVDAAPVVHGYWIDSKTVDHMGRVTGYGIDCSACDSVFKNERRDVVQHWKERFKVCPFCGAIMDGGNEDD